MHTVLIVEDDTDFRRLLREILSNNFPSLQIEEAVSNRQTLKKIKQRSPQLIFVDTDALNGSSLPLVQKIKNINPAIVVVALSLYNIPEYEDAALQSRADYYLAKSSLTFSMLVELVESIFPSPN